MEGSSPARLYALLVGGTLVVAGVIGFFYVSGFDTGDEICVDQGCDEVLGLLAVNGWHNIVHIVTGALGLLAVSYGAGAVRTYALGLGVVYLLVTFLGLIDFGSGDLTDTILKIIPVNTEDNILHLALGLLGIGAALATPKAGTTRAAAAR